MRLLCITLAFPAVCHSFPPSPLKNHVCCFIVSLVFRLALASIRFSICMSLLCIYFSPSTHVFACHSCRRLPILNFVPSVILTLSFKFSSGGPWALAMFRCPSVGFLLCCPPALSSCFSFLSCFLPPPCWSSLVSPGHYPSFYGCLVS